MRALNCEVTAARGARIAVARRIKDARPTAIAPPQRRSTTSRAQAASSSSEAASPVDLETPEDETEDLSKLRLLHHVGEGEEVGGAEGENSSPLCVCL